MITIDDLSNRDQVVVEIERICQRDDIGYIDAIVEYCEKNQLEIESIGEMIARHPMLKMKLTEEAEQCNFIEKTSKLPL